MIGRIKPKSAGVLTFFFILFLILGLLYFYDNEPELKVDQSELNTSLIEVNRNLLQWESQLIDSFILVKGYEMQRSGSGLRYSIIREGSYTHRTTTSQYSIVYTLRLLDGSVIREVNPDRPEILRLDEGRQISGMEEAIKMMDERSTWRLIIPSHLAYGMRGDKDKIPPAAILQVDLTLISIK